MMYTVFVRRTTRASKPSRYAGEEHKQPKMCLQHVQLGDGDGGGGGDGEGAGWPEIYEYS